MSATSFHDHVVKVIGALGADQFGACFFDMVRDRIDADQCTVFARSTVGQVLVLVAEGRTPRTSDLVKSLSVEYAGGAFVRDPVMKRAADFRDQRPHIFFVDPGEINDCGYRRRFYDEPQIAQEAAMIASYEGNSIYASFYRAKGQNAFSAVDGEEIERFADLALALLRKHLDLCAPAAFTATGNSERQALILERVREALLADCRKLTPREAEVCSRILLGYTVRGAGAHLNISVNTVATHRKRAYAKLSISSQNELFARYFGTVERLRLS